MILTFGKYRGAHLSEVPSRYLEWLGHQFADEYAAYGDAARMELRRRHQAWPPPTKPVPPAPPSADDLAHLAEFVEAGARILARRNEPTFGGTTEGRAAFDARWAAVQALLEQWRQYDRAREAYDARLRQQREEEAGA